MRFFPAGRSTGFPADRGIDGGKQSGGSWTSPTPCMGEAAPGKVSYHPAAQRKDGAISVIRPRHEIQQREQGRTFLTSRRQERRPPSRNRHRTKRHELVGYSRSTLLPATITARPGRLTPAVSLPALTRIPRPRITSYF